MWSGTSSTFVRAKTSSTSVVLSVRAVAPRPSPLHSTRRNRNPNSHMRDADGNWGVRAGRCARSAGVRAKQGHFSFLGFMMSVMTMHTSRQVFPLSQFVLQDLAEGFPRVRRPVDQLSQRAVMLAHCAIANNAIQATYRIAYRVARSPMPADLVIAASHARTSRSHRQYMNVGTM
jgi:hypothetical protein